MHYTLLWGNHYMMRNSLSLAVMLPYFSMIAIISLGVIGVSGLYMAWLQLQSIGSLFESSYGNILILKLCVIVPMIALGGYHQIKFHYVMVRTAQGVNKLHEQSENSLGTKQRRETRDSQNERGWSYDPFIRFSKTVKTESLIGIAVLTISTFLTITSPPSMVHSDSQMQMSGSNLENSNFQGSGNGDENKIVPKITDGFTIVALILAIIVLVMSSYYYKKNKQELKSTFNLLKTK